MAELKVGVTVVYNDGRDGHKGVKAQILTNGPSAMQVQFEDRADSTFIRHSDRAWADHIKLSGYHVEH